MGDRVRPVLAYADSLLGTLAAIACALPGNFPDPSGRPGADLADAISHVVLPASSWPSLLTGTGHGHPHAAGGGGRGADGRDPEFEAIRRWARSPGAAMGVVFHRALAGGVLLLEHSDTRVSIWMWTMR